MSRKKDDSTSLLIGPNQTEDEESELSSEFTQANTLRITVYSARYLRSSALRSTISAYVKLRSSGKEQKTSVKSKTVDPEWNETFSFRATNWTSNVTLIVSDKVNIRKRFIGQLRITVAEVSDLPTKSVRKWFDLLDKSWEPKDGLGEIELAISWVYDKANDPILKSRSMRLMSEKSDVAELNDLEEWDEEELESFIPEQDEETEEEANLRKQEFLSQRSEPKINLNIKHGDYQIQVHIIEARDLKGEDLTGSSDPVCHIEVMGKKKKTSVKYNTVGCVFDEMFFFNLKNIGKPELEEGLIKVSVYDANTLYSNTLIGTYQFDCMTILATKSREIYRQWVGLMDYNNKDDEGIQGFLMLSVSIVGPGETLKVHDRDAEIAKEFSGEMAGDISAMVLLPPSIEQRLNFLVVSVFKAEDLPALDSSGLLSSAGIDAFARVDFSGNPKCKTSIVTVKGTTDLSPVFLEELWIPVMMPTMSHRIFVSVWDHDKGSSNDLVGRMMYDFRDVLSIEEDTIAKTESLENEKTQEVYCSKLDKRWANIYGPPLTNVKKKHAKKIQSYSDTGSNYHGRLLLSFRKVTNPSSDESEIVHTKDIDDENWEAHLPKTVRYVLRCVLIFGSDIPKFHTITGLVAKMHVTVSIGKYSLIFEPQSVRNGKVIWGESKEKRSIVLPADLTQLPYIFIHLKRQTERHGYVSVSYARLRAAEFVMNAFNSEIYWQPLVEETARRDTRHALDKNQFPGTLLLKLGFGREEIAARTPWEHDFSAVTRNISCQFRVHIFQCKGLLAVSNKKSVNPYVTARFADQRKRTKRKKSTLNPVYYESLVFDVEIPAQIEYAPEISIQVFDFDRLSSNKLLGQCRLPFKSAFKTPKYVRKPPRPQWHNLCLSSSQSTGHAQECGQILLSLQYIEINSKVESIPPPISIIPEYQNAYIDIIALGVRNMLPYNYIKIQRPFIEFEITGGEYCDQNRGSRRTNPSNQPDGANANFLQRIILPVKLPVDSLYSPQLILKVYDARLGGMQHPKVAHSVLDLSNKLPWNNSDYVPPQQQEFEVTEQNERRNKIEQDYKKSLEEVEEKCSDHEVEDGHESQSDNERSGGETEEDDSDEEASPTIKNSRFFSSAKDSGSGLGDFLLKDVTNVHETPDTNDPAVLDQLAREKECRLLAIKEDAKKKGISIKKEGSTKDSSVSRFEPKYMTGRDWWIKSQGSELEHFLRTAPFETYALFRPNQSLALFRKNANKFKTQVGKFKGLVCVTDDPPDEQSNPFLDFKQLREPKNFEVRLYVLKASKLQPKDFNGLSDPYLKVKLGKKKINDRNNFKKKNLNPEFFQSFVLQTTIPGASQLEVSIWDYDKIARDELIGSTVIDLEDRWFHKGWQNIGEGHPDLARAGSLKPVEFRHLWSDSASTTQGVVQLWVDILSEAEAARFPVLDIKPPPPQEFEVRVVVWKSEDVIDRDFSEVNDLFVTVWMEGVKSQSTDVHWRCSTGRASWNWRMKFKVEMPIKAPEFGRLHVQLWDKDVIKWNDVIGETQIDLYKWLQKAYQKQETVLPFKELKVQSVAKDEDSDDEENKSIDLDKNDEKEAHSDAEDTDKRGTDSEADLSDLETGSYHNKKSEKRAEESPLLAIKPSVIKRKLPSFGKKKSDTSKKLSTRDQKKAEKEKNEAQDAIGSFLDLLGMGRLADDAEWVTMYYTDRGQGTSEKMGKVAISVQIVPEKDALSLPVGLGRDAPNVNPYLAPPVGRMKLTANPFMVLKELVGPKTCAKISCICCCMGCLAFIALFGAGIMSTLTFLQGVK